MTKDRNQVTALVRGLSVIRAFTNQSDSLTLSEVSEIVDLPRATTRRCLLTLQSLGYVEKNRNGFMITPAVLVLANAYLTSSSLLRISQPFIERISNELGEPVSLSVLSRGLVVYVARSAKRRIESLHRGIGSQLPAYCTSMGRVLLAHLDDSELDEYLKTVEIERHTPNTITDKDKLKQVITDVRLSDYCLIDAEMLPSLRAIAVPLRNASNQVVAALNVGPERKLPKSVLVKSILPVLRQAALEMKPLLV